MRGIEEELNKHFIKENQDSLKEYLENKDKFIERHGERAWIACVEACKEEIEKRTTETKEVEWARFLTKTER